MSREIKFRAWDNAKKEWTLNIMECVSSRTGNIWMEPALKSHKVVIEQYTGLKDKNGKEIYEGDIVKCYSQDTYPVGRVMYSEEWCLYEIVSYDPEDCRVYSLESFSPTVNEYLEVIGNIHENPELLGGKK